MLRLKRLELQGFKSFADRTELRFEGSGIVAVVGPNGCGKSNLADAMNWVLGEQSAKSLRGSRMEDVIFAGTRDRKPVSLASVTMVLGEPPSLVQPGPDPAKANGHANGSGVNGQSGANGIAVGANGKAAANAAAVSREVTITRRLFRSGESEYLVDGKVARLRDIQDIFMGTGLGPESYAIIEQGRIGQILSSKPQDRRAVLEEAAGISRFKSKRRLAEARLQGARHNLERVFDILEEVGRQANSLKRQASKARRYEELKSQLDAQLRLVLAARYRIVEREAAKIALDLNLITATVKTLAAEVAQSEEAQSRAQAEMFGTEARLTEARRRLADLQVELERTRGRLESQSRQVASIDQRLAQSDTERQDVEGRQARLKEELAAQQQSMAELEAQASSARARLEEKSQEREQAQREVSERERALEGSRQFVIRLLGEASSLRNQLAQVDGFLTGIERDTARLVKERESALSDLEWLVQARKELSEKAAARQLELELLAEQRRQIETGLAAAKKEAAIARQEADGLRPELSRLKARRDSLEGILSHRAYTTESVKRLFTAIERGQAQDLKPLGVLADFVEVDPVYEKAAEEFLHDELEYVVVESWPQAESGIELMRAGMEGRATFLVHPDQEAEAAPLPDFEGETGIVGRLTGYLRLTNGLSKAGLDCLPRLSRCFLAEKRSEAQRLALAHPELYFLLPDGVCYHGRAVSGGRKTSSGPLALKRELRELKAAAAAQQKKLDETIARLQSAEAETVRLERELEALRGTQEIRQREALGLEHEAKKLTDETSRANSRLSAAKLELERLEREKERAAAQRDRNRAALGEKEQKRLEQEQSLQGAREELEKLKAEAARVGEEHSALRAELAGFEERRRAQAAAAARLQNQANELAGRYRNLCAELEKLGNERSRLTLDNAGLEQKVASLAVELDEAGRIAVELADQESQLREQLSGTGESLRDLRLRAQTAQEERAQAELELVKRQSELRFLDETSRKDLSVPIEQLAEADEIPLDAEGIEAAEQKHQELKSKIEALGPVNPNALEEFRAAEERHNFLNEQRQDLLDSIRDIEKAIQDIDVESRKKFTEAFAAINVNFRELFKTLFGGGIGEMRLTDEQNVGESGIEIVASPPGKRLQSVLLLSGGEKALTALALLMAIFKYQPSPFCILDEVDAPLDDPNIERLSRLIREMSGKTQFVVITHAKRTMESAQALYGVTMQEPGVSKLVSVKFQQAPPPPPPAPADNYATA